MNNKKKILIVDENLLIRNILLKELGDEYDTATAENGVEALEKAVSYLPDLITMDIEMPRLNGKELCEKIRKDLNMTDIPILVLTGVYNRSRLLELFKAGASDYLVKPYVREELISRLASHLDRARLTRNLRKTVSELRAANDEIRKLSITDPLTGCFNRGYINDQLEKELCRAKRYNHCLGIIMCDIDHFKKVNDTFGHHAGDEVLKSFVSCIRENSHSGTDWLARYGGEEFMIILPETDLEGTTCYAERVRKSVSKMKIHCDGNEITITSSFGATAICPDTPPECSCMENLLKHADLLLYRSKNEGRNRVNSSPPTPSPERTQGK